MENKNIKLCVKCVLPEYKPDIRLNADGVCNICARYQEESVISRAERAPLETDLIKALSLNKKNGKYQCLVMCSGGKDSTAALYYMKKRYKLNPLAFTFDNGFEPQGALENIKNAVGALGVDLMMFKSDFMKDMFASIVKSGSKAVICHVCSIWYMDLVFQTAGRFDIPLIIGGWTKGQLKCGNPGNPEFVSMAKGTADFLRHYAKENSKYKDFPASVEEVIKRHSKQKHKCSVISPHWFLPFDPDSYVQIIKRELGWKPAAISYPAQSTNCRLNFLSVFLSMKYFGYSHYHVEMSKMIRAGLLTREEALSKLEIDFGEEAVLPVLDELGCAREDICS